MTNKAIVLKPGVSTDVDLNELKKAVALDGQELERHVQKGTLATIIARLSGRSEKAIMRHFKTSNQLQHAAAQLMTQILAENEALERNVTGIAVALDSVIDSNIEIASEVNRLKSNQVPPKHSVSEKYGFLNKEAVNLAFPRLRELGDRISAVICHLTFGPFYEYVSEHEGVPYSEDTLDELFAKLIQSGRTRPPYKEISSQCAHFSRISQNRLKLFNKSHIDKVNADVNRIILTNVTPLSADWERIGRMIDELKRSGDESDVVLDFLKGAAVGFALGPFLGAAALIGHGMIKESDAESKKSAAAKLIDRAIEKFWTVRFKQAAENIYEQLGLYIAQDLREQLTVYGSRAGDGLGVKFVPKTMIDKLIAECDEVLAEFNREEAA